MQTDTRATLLHDGTAESSRFDLATTTRQALLTPASGTQSTASGVHDGALFQTTCFCGGVKWHGLANRYVNSDWAGDGKPQATPILKGELRIR